MKKTAMLAVVTALAGSAMAGSAMAADVGLSINIGQPGFFGQLDLGDGPPPPPALINPQPIVIHRDRGYSGGPIYLHVPPGYERNWGRHCAQYDACGRPVYFVRDEWYQHTYVPRYQSRHHEEGRRDEERRQEDRRQEEHHDAQDRRDDHDRDH